MKQTFQLMMMTLLLFAATSAKADSYKGTMERHGSKMEYAFSGCTVTAKHKPTLELGNTFVVLVDGQITTGTTLQATCKRLKGKRSKYDLIVSWVLYYANGQTKSFKKSSANGDSPSLNLTIPEDVVKVDVDLKYEEKEWNGQSGEKLSCRMNLSVSKKNGVRPTEIYHDFDVVKIGGTIDGSTGQIIPGSDEVLAEVDYTLTVRNLHDTMFGKTSDYINGEKVTATCNVKMKREGSYTITLRNGVDNKIIKETKNAPLEATFPVLCHKDGISIVVGFKYKDKKRNQEYSTSSHMGIQTNLVEGSDVPATTTTNNFNWNDVAPDERCSHCNGQWADYSLHRGVNQYQETYGDAAKRCMSNVGNKPEKDMLEYFFGWMANNDRYSTGNPNDRNWTEFSSSERTGLYDMNIYFNDVIATKRNSRLVLDGVDGEKVLTFEPGTLAHLVKRNADGSHRWKIYKGRVIGKFFRHVGKEPVFETSSCQAKPTGTLFVLEDDGTTSQIYLLSGSMDVASKKTNKKVTLKAGQASTVGSNGQIKVQKFDVKKAAKKYGITTAELQEQVTTTTATAATKRYELERAIVKYKVTKNGQQGLLAKCFDDYGQLERRELKMGNQTTLQLTQGNTSYNLDRNAKTYQQVTNAELNFLNMNDPVMQRLKLQKKGTAKVLDRECTVYANSDTEYYVWKGIVLKKVARSGNVTTTTEATSVEQPATVDAKYFKMPEGYRKK